MRLFLFLMFCSFISVAFRAKANLRSAKASVCTLPNGCLTIINDKPIKPFNTSGAYVGRVIIQAYLDTLTMKLVKHKIVFARLQSKFDPSKQINVRLDKKSGDTKYLNSILPSLIQHLKYLKFKIDKHNNCNMGTIWHFPITIK